MIVTWLRLTTKVILKLSEGVQLPGRPPRGYGRKGVVDDSSAAANKANGTFFLTTWQFAHNITWPFINHAYQRVGLQISYKPRGSECQSMAASCCLLSDGSNESLFQRNFRVAVFKTFRPYSLSGDHQGRHCLANRFAKYILYNINQPWFHCSFEWLEKASAQHAGI